MATALLLLAGLFWFALFGNVIATLARDGIPGLLVLAAIGVLLLRPALLSVVPGVRTGLRTTLDLASRARFRYEWRWRVPAMEAFASTVPELAAAQIDELGVLAGQLARQRIRRGAQMPTKSHIHVLRSGRRGTVVVTLATERAGMPAA